MLRLLSRPLLQSATQGLKKQVGGLASRAPFSTTLKPMDSTFQHQDSLPRLPIPDLTATLEKYKEQIAPLLSTAEFEETAAYIEAFKGHSGKRLHKLLEELDEQSSTSWVEGFWDTMYLELRDPLPVNVSPFFVISDPPAGYKNPANAQAERAAALVHSLFRFQQQVRRRTLTPDMEGQGAKAKPLCMFQYSRLLGTTRIPKYNRDELHTSIHSKHIVVMRKDRIFRLDVLDEGTLGQEALLSPAQIEERLLKIIDQADTVKDYPNIGTLTTENRNTWGNLYATITAGETINDSSMDDINGALLVVCLDDVNQENANHLGRIFLHSDNRSLNANRWYDKLQLIVLPNGTAGVNMEHSPIDGHTLLRLMNDVHHDSTGTHPIVETPSLTASAALLQKSPKLLEWNIGSDVQTGIETAAKNYQGLIDSTESIALDFQDWGKETIKALKFSPDAFVQMAYQLAYYRQYGKVVSTYESCMMKNFLHGRTETIRSVSQQSVELVRKFDVAKPAESKKLLIAATTVQNETATRCKLGQGTDRHLFVLKNLAIQKMQRLAGFKVPELFNDPSYSKYMSNVLSTSNCSSDSVDLFGFGAVHPKGLGVGYVIKNNNIIFNVTSFQKPDAKEFIKHLQQSLKDLHTISSS